MSGQIKKMIDSILQQRSKGSALIKSTTEAKIVMKGVNPSKYDINSPDDPDVIAKLKNIAQEFGVTV
ncbi:MAG: hypothetical protein D6B27_09335 [Gammaproteobacteria bacterium]|nr:MAG: hypothetical protein D6B27_09335 [Gammaproteobacteria bacterium]